MATISNPSNSTFRSRLLRTGAATAAAALVGALASDSKSEWYRSLSLPAWQPPRAVFPIVWTGLYAGLAVTSAAVLARHDAAVANGSTKAQAQRIGFQRALMVNLVLDAGWSMLFWQARNPALADVEAAALAASAAELARRAARVDKRLGLSLLPYIAWTSFTKFMVSNVSKRNPGPMG